MTQKTLQKMSRSDLVELMLAQQKRLDRVEKELQQTRDELDQAKQELRSKRIIASKAGSLAEASLALTNIFTEAQKAADLYFYNVKMAIDQTYGQQKHEED